MNSTVERLLEDALRLSENDRAAVAGALIESLHGAPEAGVREAWAVESVRRASQLDAGEVSAVRDADARAAIFGREP